MAYNYGLLSVKHGRLSGTVAYIVLGYLSLEGLPQTSTVSTAGLRLGVLDVGRC